MTIKSDFLSLTNSEEEIQSYAKPDDEEVARIELAVGAGNISRETINELLSRQKNSFSILKSTQDDVRRELLEGDGSQKMMASILQTIGKVILIVISNTNEMNKKSGELQAVISSPPEKKSTDTSDKLSQLEDDIKRIRNFSNNLDSISGIKRSRESSSNLIDSLNNKFGLSLTENDLDTYITGGEIYSSTESIQVVDQISDDFYALVNSRANNVNVEIIKDIKLIDIETNTEISEISGVSSFSFITPEIIRVDNVDGSSNTMRIDYTSPNPIKVKKKLSSYDAAGSAINSAIASSEAVKDSLSFEIWACLVLDIVDDLFKTWENYIKPELYRVINLFKINKDIVNGFPVLSLPAIGTSILGDSALIQNALAAIKSPSDFAIESLGIRDSIIGGDEFFSGNTTVCEANHKSYCSINFQLSNLLKNLFVEIDGLALKLDGFDLNLDISSFIDQLNVISRSLTRAIESIDESMTKLKKDVCAWVSRRLRGKPKTLSLIIASLFGLIPVLSSAILFASPSFWGFETSDVIQNSIDKLKKFNYDYAASLLEDGKVQEFLELELTSATNEGQAAALLLKAASEESDLTKKLLLNNLSKRYEDESVSKRSSAMVREFAINRYRFNSVTRNASAKEMRELGDNLLS